MGIKVLLADWVLGGRRAEKGLLEKEPDIEVVGEAADGPEAMRLIESLQPQVVVTDFSIQSTGKIFAKQIKAEHPRIKVLGVTAFKGKYVKNFVKIFGADELLDRNELETKLITTLKLLAQG
jgi:DNA-binding NarL/FixJ family response regulator